MTTDRCPACGAAVAAGAPWCTLCFADLRPRSVATEAAATPAGAEVPAVPAEAAATALASAVDPLTAPLATLLAPPAPVASAGAVAPAMDQAPAGPDEPRVVKRADVDLATPSWPCGACGASVPLNLDACPVCGGRFLGGAEPGISLDLPVVGDVVRLGPGQRWAVVGVGAAVVTVVLFLVLALLGSVL